jgi:hypothetical protein
VTGADTIVVPNTNGTNDTTDPFDIKRHGLTSRRYQQVYSASGFAAWSTPRYITRIAFRPRPGGQAFSYTIPRIQINLSTTARVPANLAGEPANSLSTTFADNPGSDDTVVFNGALSLSSTGGPSAFDVAIPLQIWFLYRPGAGNLLLDIRLFDGPSTTPLDAEYHDYAHTVSKVTNGAADGVYASSGFKNPSGLVTQFTGTTSATRRVTGTILDLGGGAVSGVLLSGFPGNPTTDASGQFSGDVGHGWSGTVTPSKTGYTFLPSSRTYIAVAADLPDQDYAGFPAPTLDTEPVHTQGTSNSISWTAVAGATDYEAQANQNQNQVHPANAYLG